MSTLFIVVLCIIGFIIIHYCLWVTKINGHLSYLSYRDLVCIRIVYIATVYEMFTYFLIVYFSNLLEYLDLGDHCMALPCD